MGDFPAMEQLEEKFAGGWWYNDGIKVLTPLKTCWMQEVGIMIPRAENDGATKWFWPTHLDC